MQFQANDKYETTKLMAQLSSPSPAQKIIDNSVITTNVQSADPISITIAIISLIVSMVKAFEAA